MLQGKFTIFISIFLISLGGICNSGPQSTTCKSIPGFIENKGQILNQKNKPNPGVLFLLNTPGMKVQLRKGGFSYDLFTPPPAPPLQVRGGIDSVSPPFPGMGLRGGVYYHRIDIDLQNSNLNPAIIPSEPSPDYLNYYTTGTPDSGIRMVRQYGRVTYRGVYPGIDLEFISTGKQGYKYNFIVHPGGKIRDIRLKISGPDKITLEQDTLKFVTHFGEAEELIPESYFQANDSKVSVRVRFQRISEGIYGFSAQEAIPENSTLVVDPTAIRLWGTYFGGPYEDGGYDYVAVDLFNNVFFTGWVSSLTNIATEGSYQDTIGGNWDLFLAKFTAGGQRVWATYIGGTEEEIEGHCAIDKTGNIYVAGATQSSNGIASAGAHQTTFGGGIYWDCFLEKFNNEGFRLWGTYYGGSNNDEWSSVCVDKYRNVFLAGATSSTNAIATAGSWQPNLVSNGAAFLAKFDSNGVRQWGTYYGGETLSSTGAYGCTTDNSGNVYLSGETSAQTNIATSGVFQPTFGGGFGDGFIAKFTNDGQRIWGTYYGGPNIDFGWSCMTDSAKNVILTGETNSASGIASTGAHQTTLGGGIDNFIAKLDSNGLRLWGSYYGGAQPESDETGCSLGSNGDIFMAGTTHSNNNISTNDSYQPYNLGSVYNAYLVKFNEAGQRKWGTYYGGPVQDGSNSICYVRDDTLYMTGFAWSLSNIASQGSYQEANAGFRDAMLVKFLECWPIDTAGPIVGPVEVCKPSSSVNYSVPTLPHAANYVWTLPAGFTVSAGFGMQSIFVDISGSATSGTIWVKGLNKCGDAGDSASLDVTVHSRPVPEISGPDNTCAGPGNVYTTDLGYTNYQWSTSPGGLITNGGMVTDNSATVTWSIAGSQHVYLNYTDINGCSAENPTDFPVMVNPSPSAGITISPSSNNVCEGTEVLFTATPVNGGSSPTYQWFVNGGVIPQYAPTMSYVPANGDFVHCILTSSVTGCILNNPATSDTITIQVYPASPVSVTITVSDDTVCTGTSVLFTATPVNGGSSPAYQWFVNGLGVSQYTPTMSYIPVNGDVVTCVLTSSNTVCISNNPATSNAIVMVVNPLNPVSVSIAASANPFCQGSQVTFTATPVNGGSNPLYQWFVNGAGGMIQTIPSMTYIPANGDIVYCILTSNIACPTGNPATSNSITMAENTNVPVSISISPSSNPVCAGTSVTFTATPVNGGSTPQYQWKVNGINAGANFPTYSYVPLNSDVVNCMLTSNAVCASGNPATSNALTMTVNPNLPVSLTISATPPGAVCAGTTVLFTATGTNPGANPLYQWKVNGINAGGNSTTYSYVPVSGDQVICTLNSDATCATGNPANSNAITMTVHPNQPVSVSIAASANPVCSGITVNYTATAINGGAMPVYQWKVNGVNAGTNSANYSYAPVAGDQIQCILNSNITCSIGNPATSNTITMNVAGSPVVTLTRCNDSVTTVNAQPFKLKGGIPLGGTYSGSGVNNGIFYPAIAGIGTKTITYSYTNAALCSASATKNIYNLPFTIDNCGTILTDRRDNKQYQTVQIGTQCWMASNLNFGTMIPSNLYQRDNCIAEKYCFQEQNVNCNVQGANYQWDEMVQFDEALSSQGICPPAWHIPSETEWNTLFANWNGSSFSAWPLLTTGYSGFNATLAGTRHMNLTWDWLNFATMFWSSTSYGPNKAWAHGLNGVDPSVSLYPALRTNAFSVRCLKD
jgi:uncharacterized protein (TIGR02145 family)